jgi:hypothetical protein
MGGHGSVVVIGELTTTAFVDVNPIAKRICWENIGVLVNIVQQSPEIAQGVDTGGAGDQGIMVGYATRETPNYMPLEYELARRLNEFLWKLHPNDGKTQVTLDVTDERWEIWERSELVAVVVSWCGTPASSAPTQKSAELAGYRGAHQTSQPMIAAWSSISIPQVTGISVDSLPIQVSQDANSLSITTDLVCLSVVVRSQEKTQRKSTVLLPTRLAKWPSNSSKKKEQTKSWYKSPMLSATVTLSHASHG